MRRREKLVMVGSSTVSIFYLGLFVVGFVWLWGIFSLFVH